MRHFFSSTELADHRSRTRLLHRWWLLGVVVLLVGLAAAGPALAQEDEPSDLSGIVTLNGEVAPDGIGLLLTAGKQSSTN